MSRTSKNSLITTPRATAFTLVELCTVVTMLALFVLLFHASAGTRPVSHAARCLNNLRQLMNGWRMYSDDYADTLVPNHFGADVNPPPGAALPPALAGGIHIPTQSVEVGGGLALAF